MQVQPPYHEAYVLWLIREQKVKTLGDLWAHFEKWGPTGMNMLGAALESLERAQLIDAEPRISSLRTLGWEHDQLKNIPLHITPLLADVQNSLKISLTDLAKSDLAQRILATPVLRRTFSTRYSTDIFVLMPFTSELEPVYEDHLKHVAEGLQLTISRADNFFTSENIMDEIWTGIVNSGIIIADCTGRNPNVFYEIGLCHAIGKKTILVTQSKDDIPFDLRHRRFIEYRFSPRGMKEFEEAIRATLKTFLEE